MVVGGVMLVLPAVPVAGGVMGFIIAGGAMLPAAAGGVPPAVPVVLGGIVIEPGVIEELALAPACGAPGVDGIVDGLLTLGEQLGPVHGVSPCLLSSSPLQPVTTATTVVVLTNHNFHPVPMFHHPVSSGIPRTQDLLQSETFGVTHGNGI
jgi:hypothetical protein